MRIYSVLGITLPLIIATARLAKVPGSHPLSIPSCSNPHLQFYSWQFPLTIVIDLNPVDYYTPMLALHPCGYDKCELPLFAKIGPGIKSRETT